MLPGRLQTKKECVCVCTREMFLSKLCANVREDDSTNPTSTLKRHYEVFKLCLLASRAASEPGAQTSQSDAVNIYRSLHHLLRKAQTVHPYQL